MSDRFDLKYKPNNAKQRVAHNEARRVLEAGCNCDECKAVHANRKAVAFVMAEAPPGSEIDFMVCFLCELHADIFLKNDAGTGVFLNGRKIAD